MEWGYLLLAGVILGGLVWFVAKQQRSLGMAILEEPKRGQWEPWSTSDNPPEPRTCARVTTKKTRTGIAAHIP